MSSLVCDLFYALVYSQKCCSPVCTSAFVQVEGLSTEQLPSRNACTSSSPTSRLPLPRQRRSMDGSLLADRLNDLRHCPRPPLSATQGCSVITVQFEASHPRSPAPQATSRVGAVYLRLSSVSPLATPSGSRELRTSLSLRLPRLEPFCSLIPRQTITRDDAETTVLWSYEGRAQ